MDEGVRRERDEGERRNGGGEQSLDEREGGREQGKRRHSCLCMHACCCACR